MTSTEAGTTGTVDTTIGLKNIDLYPIYKAAKEAIVDTGCWVELKNHLSCEILTVCYGDRGDSQFDRALIWITDNGLIGLEPHSLSNLDSDVLADIDRRLDGWLVRTLREHADQRIAEQHTYLVRGLTEPRSVWAYRRVADLIEAS